MSLNTSEVKAIEFVLSNHYKSKVMSLDSCKEVLSEWSDIVTEYYACQENVPLWVTQLSDTIENIKRNLIIENDEVVFLSGQNEK